MRLRRRPLVSTLALALAAAALPAGAALVPPQVPDRLPLAAEPLRRGVVLTTEGPDRRSTPKTVDGQVGDWTGRATGIGGTTRWDRGELVHTDFVFDDWGADDGGDAQRLSVLGPLREAESRTARVDQLFQAAGEQFGAPRPVGALDHYGDLPAHGPADLREVRLAADGLFLSVLARTTTLTDPASLGVVLLVDRDGEAGQQPVEVGFGTGLRSAVYDIAVLLTDGGVTTSVIRPGSPGTALPAPGDVAQGRSVVVADGWTNALEAQVNRNLLGESARVGLVSGARTADGIKPANVAFRSAEPVAGVYNDQAQALALHARNVDAFAQPFDVQDSRDGRTQEVRLGPGYHERQVVSGENISRENGEHGLWQPYGLYVPTSYSPGRVNPLTFWLHYRGGKAHSGGAWTPRLITQLGEERGNVVVTPRGRGTSTWYVTEAHQDFFEVFADVHQLVRVDEDRRYLSGYSMGGYGTYLFGLLYPDLFAGGFSSSGAMTQGAWTGVGPDGQACAQKQLCYVEANGGDADAQNTFRLLANARNLPLAIHHGTDDELVPVSGIERIGLRLTELGYRHDVTRFVGYEHFTQAIVDEWADGAAYLDGYTRVRDPRTVAYTLAPALVRAVNTVTADGVAYDFRPDGAYWVDGLQTRTGADGKNPSVTGTITATSEAVAEKAVLTLPRTGAASPLGHSTPFVRSGLDWLQTGGEHPLRNAFNVTLRNIGAATLDADRMRLDPTRTVVATVDSDGPAVLTLTGLGEGEERIEVPAGTTRIELSPRR